MLNAVVNYFHERRRGVTRIAGYIGGAYLLGHYVAERLEDVRTRVIQDRVARDNLKRRFEQNQQDVSFTVMALLPSLGKHIIEGMDVEGVTYELQSFTKASKSQLQPQLPAPSSQSSIELARSHDVRSENGSISVISSIQEGGGTSDLTASSTSWMDQLSMQSSQLSRHYLLNGSDLSPNPDSPKSNIGTDLSDSITTTSSSTSSAAQQDLRPSPPESNASEAPNPNTRSKADLWKEVKILTFTRTLTIIYSVTLLSIFTHLQLNLLGRSKYIQSVIQLERDERARERLRFDTSIHSLFWGDSTLEEGDAVDNLEEAESVSEETERKYLTLSWWILHVGWKDVGERVRRGVEEVFEGVSLKTKFTIGDLYRLVSDVRRRVEYEVTFEGKERRINFMSTLLPPTPETLQHVLTQGGIPARIATDADPKFHSLLSETRAHLGSASFHRVLEVCLDQATEILFSGLQKHVFGSASLPSGLGDDQEVRERLAAMLPGLARWCHLALEGLPNELVDGLADVREMAAFAAIIYSNYEDRFP
ncbi:hypothetical protein AcV7_002135 [Taiwanofungus camphoratus]|nr:hypothetical protein AcV7_002135 [Antrodia cinnamomea]